MALATQCPHCHTTFRVAADQLKLRGGIVRCGACHEIFDGNAGLVAAEALNVPTPAPAHIDAVRSEAPPSEAPPSAPAAPETTPSGAASHAHVLTDQSPYDAPAADAALEADVAPAADAALEADVAPAADAALEADVAPADEAAIAMPAVAEADLAADAGMAPEAAPATIARSADAPAHNADPADTRHADADLAAPSVAEADVETPVHADAVPAPSAEAEVEAKLEAEPALPADAEPEPPAAAAEPSASAAFDAEMVIIEAKVAQAEREAEAARPSYKLDFDTTFDPYGVLPKKPEPAPDLDLDLNVDDEPAAEPEAQARPDDATASATAPAAHDTIAPAADIEEISALPAPHSDDGFDDDAAAPAPHPPARHHDDDIPSEASLLRAPSAPEPELPRDVRAARLASARALARARTEPSTALVVVPKPAADPDEPEFVRRSRLAEKSGRTRRMLMVGASVLLTLLLLVQAVFTFHNPIAAQVPALKPALAGACTVLGCRIDLPAQVEMLSIDSGDMQTLGTNTYKLSTQLNNRSTTAQAWPNIELILHDDADKTLLRRVITPADYLPAGSVAARGFPARSEQPVTLYFETSQPTADGYHLDIFYP